MSTAGPSGTKSRPLLVEALLFSAIAAAMMLATVPARAASVSPADEAAVRSIVQETWARYGTTGIPHGPVYDPPSTPEFAALKARCEKLSKTSKVDQVGDSFSACQWSDNPYDFTWNEYHPHLGDVQIVGINPDLVEAQIIILLGHDGPNAGRTVMRFVHSSNGWLLDDIRMVDDRGKQLGTSMREFLKISIEEMQ